MKKNTKAWLFLICIIGLILIVALFIYGSKTTKQNQDEQSESISLDDDPDVNAYKVLDAEFQSKVTSFDESKYKMPITNLASKVEMGSCTNGFGGAMPNIFQGVYSEPLYNFDAEILPTDHEGVYGYAPYVNAYYVVGDILFRQPQDFFDRKIITFDQLNRNFTDTRIIVGNRSYKSSFQRMESKYGFPTAYVQQQSGNIATLSAFNDGCVKGVGVKEITFAKVDLSGKTVNSIFSSYFQTSSYHGANGLYSVTNSTPDFVGAQFLDWMRSNNKIWLSIINDPENTVFPKGSVMYLPKAFKAKEEILTVNLSSSLDGTLTDWKRQVEEQTSLSGNAIRYVEEKFPDFTLIKAVKLQDLSPLNMVVAVDTKGQLHPAVWELPVTRMIDGTEQQRANLVMFNLAATKQILTLTKSRYQGKQLDASTENENLNLKSITMTSPKAKERQDDLRKELTESYSKLESSGFKPTGEIDIPIQK